MRPAGLLPRAARVIHRQADCLIGAAADAAHAAFAIVAQADARFATAAIAGASAFAAADRGRNGRRGGSKGRGQEQS
jgi:hypothetical protein